MDITRIANIKTKMYLSSAIYPIDVCLNKHFLITVIFIVRFNSAQANKSLCTSAVAKPQLHLQATGLY
jgi:hypothetical protein